MFNEKGIILSLDCLPRYQSGWDMGSLEKIPLSGRIATIPRAVTEEGGMDDFLILHARVLSTNRQMQVY